MRGLNWLTGRNKQAKAAEAPAKPHIRADKKTPEAGWHPVQSAAACLESRERRQLIRVLSENSPLSKPATEAWWLSPLEQMAARVQACPAAWNGPFSDPGGFIDLSLTVATRAVRLVRGMMLPPGATPEEQSEQAPGWVCAVYWAGLFHHINWLSQMEGGLENGRVWYPGMSEPTGAWRVRPARNKGGEMSGTYMALSLLPDAGILWLQRWPALSDSLLLYLSGRRKEAGILNSIINDAITSWGMSSGLAISETGSQELSPALVAPGTDYTPPKLYETEATPLSSHSTEIAELGPIKTDVTTYSTPQIEKTMSAVMPITELSLGLQSALQGEETLGEADDEVLSDSTERHLSTDNLMSMLDLMADGQSPTVAAVTSLTTDIVSMDEFLPDTQFSGQVSGRAYNPGEVYLEWLRDSVQDGTLSVNEKDSILHVLAQFVFLVSPGCFYRYTSSAGEEAVDKDKLQKSFESLNIHHSRNGKGLFHYHQYDSPDKSGRFTKVSGYMINADIIFKKGSCPSDSLWLSARK